MSADVEIQGIDEALAMLRAIDPAIVVSLMAVGLEAQNRIAPYPAASHREQAFKTLKQRRGFFAKLRKGQIRVPYPRSNDTLNRWSLTPNGKSVDLRNTSPHAKWVHSAQQQAAYHKGTWTTDKHIADEIVGDGTAARIVEQAVVKVVGGS